MLHLFPSNFVLLVCLSSVTFSGLCLDWTTTGIGCALQISSPAYGWSYFWGLQSEYHYPGFAYIIYQGEATKDGDENEGKKQRAEVFRQFTLSCSLAEKLRLLSLYDEY